MEKVTVFSPDGLLTNEELAIENLEMIVRYMKDKKDTTLDLYADMIEWQIRRLKKL